MTKRVVPATEGFTLDDHARRIRALEALTPENCCETPWMRRSREILNPQTIVQNSIVEFDFDTTVESDGSLFISSSTSGIVLPYDGEYLITGEAYFSDFGGGGRDVWLGWDDLSNQHFSYNRTSAPAAIQCTFWASHRYPALTQIRMIILHTAPASVDVEGVYFEVSYVGSYTGPSPFDGNPNW